MTATAETGLKTGDEYREALRDEREVWYRGERVEDVTTHPATSGAIDVYADLYDQQFEAAHQDVLTFVREDGRRVSTCWMVPRTPEDLARKRACTEHIAWHTCGVMGRQPDLLPWTHIGLVGVHPSFQRHCPEHADNLLRYVDRAQEENTHLAGVIIEPQGTRSRSALAGEERDGVLHVVEENAEGIVIRGARAVGSYAAQANELLVGNIYYPNVRPNESFWCALPVGSSPGLRLILRETTAAPPDASDYEHPLAVRGEETDCFVIFRDVLVPWDRVFSVGAPELHNPLLFGEVARGEHWHALNRVAIKAKVLAGAAQAVVEALALEDIPAIRDQVAKMSQYATILNAGVLAAEELATMSEGGVLLPDVATVRATRAYALDTYPEMIHILQELCGQGLVMRFSDRDFAHPEIAEELEHYLAQNGGTANAKNRLMNFVWDLTTGAHAGRTALFENVNGLPAYMLRQLLYLEDEPNRKVAVQRLGKTVGLD
jgi:4-hydroxyphenylacetate 3-monooxygenase